MNEWDWLGQGVYFWEYAPIRASQWAGESAPDRLQSGFQTAIIEARIRVGRCLNLLDTEHSLPLKAVYQKVAASLPHSRPLRNTPNGAHFLDRAIVDTYCRLVEEGAKPYQTVRGCFPEGKPVFGGSKILSKTHIQIAERDLACISRVRVITFD